MNKPLDMLAVNSAAKVLTQGDTFDKRIPLRINGSQLTIERHLRTYDSTSWSIIRRRMLEAEGFTEAVFDRISQIEGVMFSTTELARLLLELPEGKQVKELLAPYLGEKQEEKVGL